MIPRIYVFSGVSCAGAFCVCTRENDVLWIHHILTDIGKNFEERLGRRCIVFCCSMGMYDRYTNAIRRLEYCLESDGTIRTRDNGFLTEEEINGDIQADYKLDKELLKEFFLYLPTNNLPEELHSLRKFLLGTPEKLF